MLRIPLKTSLYSSPVRLLGADAPLQPTRSLNATGFLPCARIHALAVANQVGTQNPKTPKGHN